MQYSFRPLQSIVNSRKQAKMLYRSKQERFQLQDSQDPEGKYIEIYGNRMQKEQNSIKLLQCNNVSNLKQQQRYISKEKVKINQSIGLSSLMSKRKSSQLSLCSL